MASDQIDPITRQRLINRRVDPHAEGCACLDPECCYQELDPPVTAEEVARWPHGLPLVTGDCTCDSEKCCQGDQSEDAYDPETGRIEGLTHLEALDALNDLINGLRHWKQTKLTGLGHWDECDEALARWVDASEIALD